jgi:hypothetical protein
MYVHQAKPANPERTPISCSLMGSLREQFRLPSNQRAAVRVSIAHQIFIPKRTPSRGLFLPKRLFLARYLLGTPELSRLARVVYRQTWTAPAAGFGLTQLTGPVFHRARRAFSLRILPPVRRGTILAGLDCVIGGTGCGVPQCAACPATAIYPVLLARCSAPGLLFAGQ